MQTEGRRPHLAVAHDIMGRYKGTLLEAEVNP